MYLKFTKQFQVQEFPYCLPIVLGDFLCPLSGARLEPKSKQGDLVLRSRRAWERSRVKNLKTK